MKPVTILDYTSDEIAYMLMVVKDVADGTIRPKDAPWITNLYFAGATLCVDINLRDREDVFTFNHCEESVGFFSGGLRRLLSIPACKTLEQLLVMSDINHEPKWLV